MSQEFKVTALIPTYNRGSCLTICIDSLLNQTVAPSEIIIIDDGSTDHTASVARQYGRAVKYIHKDNGGKASALNTGLAEATGDLIWICDDDDIADPRGLETLLTEFQKSPELDFVCGHFERFKTDTNGDMIYMPPSFFKRDEEPNLKINFLEDMFTFQFAMLVKKSAYQKLGHFDEHLLRSQDYEMTLRLTRRGTGREIPDVIFYQREHDNMRGTSATVINPEQNEQTWISYDHIFFEKILAHYNSEEFAPEFALNWEGTSYKRACHIQKGMIAARKMMWEQAVAAFTVAAEISPEEISEHELHLCKVALRHPRAWLYFAGNTENIKRLQEFRKLNPTACKITTYLLKSFRWMIKNAVKDRDFKRAFKLICLRLRFHKLR